MTQDALKRESPHAFHALSGGGTMGALVRAHPWEETPLGPIASWPQSLVTAVSICLKSRFPMLIWWGPDLTMIYNDGYRVIAGSKHPHSLGGKGREVWPEIWDVIGPLLQGVMTRGEASWSEDSRLLLERKGFLEETFFTFSYSPIHDESGGISGAFSAVSETTDKVIGERRLNLLRELGARTVEARSAEDAASLAAGVLEGVPNDVPFARLYLADVHHPVARLQGRAGAVEAPAPGVVDLSGPAPEDSWDIARVLQSGREVFDERRRALLLPVGQDGAKGVLVAGISPHLEFNAHYRGFFTLLASHVSTALAKAHAYEEERKRAEALAELDRAKTTFFSNVSHELRTPLTLILGPLEELLSRGKDSGLSGADRQALELTHRNALRLLKLVNSLLDFSRIEAGRIKARYRPTALSPLTTELASVFRSTVEAAGLALNLEVSELDAPVYVDREMWEKIVFNLLSNAFKFTLSGAITVGLSQRGDKVRLSVRDTGTGIPEAELPRLFERFHRIEGARGRTHEGTGIGLALVQELVKLHGGAIEVKSQPDVGSEFTVEIPLGRAHLPAEHVSEDGGAEPAFGTLSTAFVEESARWLPDLPGTPGLGSLGAVSADPWPAARRPEPRARLLLADDNSDMRGYMKNLLGATWDVDVVADGEAALRAARARPPDLILSDVMMPGLDGVALTRALRAEPETRTIPIILLSARAGEEARIEGLDAGADDYLTKPFSARELLARVSANLAISRLRKESQEQLAALLRREQDAHRRAELAREELHAFFMQAPAPMCILSGPEHVFTLANPLYVRLVGREVVGRSVREVFSPTEAQAYLVLMDRVFTTGEPYHGKEMPLRLENPDGGATQLLITLIYQPFRGVDGEVKGILAFIHDVTEQVEARRKVEKLADDLQKAVYARDEFLSIASHELKTPITSLKLQLHMTRRRLGPGHPQAPASDKLLPMIDASTRQLDRLTRLIEDLLDVSRIRAGKLGFSFEEVRVEELLREVVERFAEQLEQARCQLELRVEPGLTAVWDRSRMEQVLVNLLSNAIKYAPGSPIHISASAEGPLARLMVRDFGPGIPKDHQARIFERFERATVTRNISGLGLGLFIAREIVEGHQGTIHVESETGQGASFVVCLPLRPEQGSERVDSGMAWRADSC